ncbi:MAG TPA: transposase [Candidatus Paceibacterota bacterium]
MPGKRPALVNNEIYHVVLRGVGDERIFKDEDDYYRGIFSLFEFNTTKPVEIRIRRRKRKIQKLKGEPFTDERDKLVEVLQFCFMPNHIHLLIRQIKEKGITEFIRKFGTGFASYFNKKYERKGHLFQGRFYDVHIKNDEQLRTVFVYIHTNPIALLQAHWKEKGLENSQKVIEFLEAYKWSSYLDYLGNDNFPSVTEREFLLDVLGGSNECKRFVNDWVKYKKELRDWREVGIE